jgi:integrase
MKDKFALRSRLQVEGVFWDATRPDDKFSGTLSCDGKHLELVTRAELYTPEPFQILGLEGLRVGELLASRWGNIDVKARMLRVCETVYEGHFDKPKTKRSVRTIRIGKETAEILERVLPLSTQWPWYLPRVRDCRSTAVISCANT